MLLVIPVSRADTQLIPVVTQAFSQFHPGAGHDLLVVGSPNVKTEVNLVALTLAHYFNTSGTHIFPEDNHYGWPISCNYYWKQTANFVFRHYKIPWLWFELDTTPIKTGWLSMLEQDYVNGGKPFCGTKEPAVLADDNGFQTQDGHYMVPVGMYPYDTPERVLNLPALDSTIRRWWYFCQWMIVPYMSETNLIQNNWSTIRYKRTKEGIVCEDYSNMAWIIPKESRILDPTAIVHGCKDGSLATLYVLAPPADGPTRAELLAKRKKKYAALRKAKAETEINA